MIDQLSFFQVNPITIYYLWRQTLEELNFKPVKLFSRALFINTLLHAYPAINPASLFARWVDYPLYSNAKNQNSILYLLDSICDDLNASPPSAA